MRMNEDHAKLSAVMGEAYRASFDFPEEQKDHTVMKDLTVTDPLTYI